MKRRDFALYNDILRVRWHSFLCSHDPVCAYYYRTVQTEYQMRFTESHLAHAYEAARAANDSLSSCYFAKHLEQERGHHRWAVNDLEQIEVTRHGNPVPNNYRLLAPSTIGMMKEISALLSRGDYIGYLGYISLVEGFPATLQGIDHLRVLTRLPDSCFSELSHHAVLDQVHSSELFSFMQTLDLPRRLRRSILHVAGQTVAMLVETYTTMGGEAE